MSNPSQHTKISAPGKILLSGEYAVLEGAEAVVMAVERRAYARLADEPQKLSPFLRAVREELAEVTAFGGVGRAAIEAARHVIVDTSELCAKDGTKLGLGSSAATTVAAAACALTVKRSEIPVDLVHQVAHRAHGAAQDAMGARGSGADIAACVYGGVNAVRTLAQADEPCIHRALSWPAGAHFVAVWTGMSADTVSLLNKVRAFRLGDRGGYERAISEIADVSARFADALERADVPALLQAVRDGAHAVAGFGKQAKLELATKAHKKIADVAESFGGAAKPTGAGAGDMTIAVFDSADSARGFARKVASRKLVVLDDLAIATSGVRRD